VCGREEFLPYKCSYCGGTFCTEHRLPENHDCPALSGNSYWNVPVKVKRSETKARRSFKISNYGINNTIIIICAVLFFISLIARREMVYLFALDPVNFIVMPWQIITSMFLHIEFWHFFVNMFVLLFFGNELERRVGEKTYLKIFFLAGLAGNLGYILYSYALNQYIPALGASAAIFGVMGCLAIIAPEIRIMIFPVPIPIGIRTALILFAAYDFWMMIASISGFTFTNVANIAHLAGLALGLYYGKKLGRRVRHYY
jgi:hypothetical protein